MRQLPIKMTEWLLERFKTSFKNAIEAHRRNLRTSEGQARLGISLLLYFPISSALIESNIVTGISFVFCGFMAIYSGIIYKGRKTMAFVICGFFLGLTVLPTALGAYKSIQGGDWIGGIPAIFLALLLWFWSSRMKTGEPPE